MKFKTWSLSAAVLFSIFMGTTTHAKYPSDITQIQGRYANKNQDCTLSFQRDYDILAFHSKKADCAILAHHTEANRQLDLGANPLIFQGGSQFSDCKFWIHLDDDGNITSAQMSKRGALKPVFFPKYTCSELKLE